MVVNRVESGQGSPRNHRSVTAYAAPMVTFGVLTAVGQFLPTGTYPLFYVVKVAAVTAVLFYFQGPLSEVRPCWAVVPLGAAVGLVIVAQWLLIDRLLPHPHLGSRAGYDPFAAIGTPWMRWTFLILRFYGLVLVVPVMEEVFWRSFLLRYVTRGDFTSLETGQFSLGAFWIVLVLSAAAHPEWLVAAVASALFAWLLRRTRSLFAVILAHSVANAALGGYIVAAGQWKYW
jgi:uncharacterized protein